jgi:hypothetical protein
MMRFTVEESNLICCFDTSTRSGMIDEMKSIPLNDIDNETAEMLYRIVGKLEKMTDAEFSAISFTPDTLID